MKYALLTVAPLALCAGQGIISTVAGSGTLGFSGDGGPATSAGLNLPTNMAVDREGNLYIADYGNGRIRKVTPGGIISTFAGTGTGGFSGDGGPATSAQLFQPTGVALDSAGNVYIADDGNSRIRKVNSAGVITTIAGGGFQGGDNIPATTTGVGPNGMFIDSSGTLYFADTYYNLIRKISPAGIITTIVRGGRGFGGDGGPAVDAKITFPGGIVLDAAGNIYFMDGGNSRIRKINTAGIISTIAGNGTRGFSGDNGPAVNAQISVQASESYPQMAVDSAGNLYFADKGNNRVRKIDTNGIITTVAGSGVAAGVQGDGGPATSASILAPNSVAFDSSGNLYIADMNHNKIRKVTSPTAAPPGPPVITSVVNGASFQNGIVANSWVTIRGTNLASTTADWSNAIVDGRLPTSLSGVSVSMGGKATYIYYISPGQLNVLAPDVNSGPISVTVTTPLGTSSAFNSTGSVASPAFFLWPNDQVVATRQDFSFAVRPGTFAGVNTVAAKQGDVLILWANGFGPTNPTTPVGVAVPSDQSYSAATAPTVTINNVPATVYGAALAPGAAGLYQIAIQVPDSLADGDWPIRASVGGAQSPMGTILTVRRNPPATK